ncbi:MAG: Bacterial regulatory protein luxR family [Thermomicrobiales bacterium]|nr:Bacterial regulatory protein luxR family [Thermomicrobiales bacterium]
MCLCTYERARSVDVGIERDGQVYPTGYADMLTLIRDGEVGLARATVCCPKRSEHSSVSFRFSPAGSPLRRRARARLGGALVGEGRYDDAEPLFAVNRERARELGEETWWMAHAEALHIGPGTVRTHVSNILSKLSVRTRTEAATYAHRQGLV